MRKRRSELLVLAIDIGTSSTRTTLFDGKARSLTGTSASEQYSLRYTGDGGAELSPSVLRRAVSRCLARTLRQDRYSHMRKDNSVAAVCGSAFWHGLLGLDRQSQPITPIFTWADSRSATEAARLRERFSEKEIHARTGCMLRATFWPAKLRWLRRTQPNLFRRVEKWVSPADWVFSDLFGQSGTSASMASATGLYNLTRRDWDDELCDACQVDPNRLSKLTDIVAKTSARSTALAQARIFPAIGDGAAGNIGSGADRQGIVAINVGTSAAVRMMQTNRQAGQTNLPLGLFRYIVDPQRSVIGGAVSNAGNLRQWCLHELRLQENSREIASAFSRSAGAVDSLVVLPFWVSERAPSWPERQSGVIDGLKQSTSAADILRATTTALFYRLAQILDLMESATERVRRIIVSGGMSRSPTEMKLLADALGRDIEVAHKPEASLRGAAIHALNQLGIQVETGTGGKIGKCDRALAAKHRHRRQRQIDLEALLTSVSRNLL
jgi:gluconokinase